jgi:hypothetical protein
MIRYIFTAIGFQPGGNGRQTGTRVGKRQHTKRNNTQQNTTTIQKHRIHKIENKNTKQNNKQEKYLKT